MGSRDSFVHLHVHTEYSMLDGAARLGDLFAETERMGMPALAMTDHGNVFGAFDFWKKARAAGVKPIIGCLLAGQEIATADGIKNVEDIAVGDMVLTHRGRFRRVMRTMRRPYEGRGYDITLAGGSGRKLTLTEEHPVLIRTRDGMVDWRKPGDIATGRPGIKGGVDQWNSWVCLPRLAGEVDSLNVLDYLPDDFQAASDGGLFRVYPATFRADSHWPKFPSALPLDIETGYVLGLFAAEGHVQVKAGTHTGVFGFDLHSDETHLADRVERVLAAWGIATQRHVRPDKHSMHVYGCSAPLARLLDSLCGRGAAEKRVPAVVLQGPAALRDGFLDGVLDGDGKDASRASNPTGRRDFTTISRNLAWGVRTLLADTGHWSTVRRLEDWSCPPGSVEAKRTSCYMVGFSPRRSYARTKQDDRFTYSPVQGVTPRLIVAEVFNLEVEEDNSYVSDFVLHNCEAYVTPGTHRSDKTRVRWADGGGDDVSGGGAYTHMTMLAETTEGMHNLFRLSSLASLEGYYYKPRMDRELLQTYGKGLIATTGCASGEIQTLIRIGRYDDAKRSAAELQDLFGKDNFFCELMDHGLDIERRAQADLIRLGKELAMPFVATNDLHYTWAKDAEAHAILLCVQSGRTLADPTRFKFDADDFYLKSPAEMRDLWADYPEACDNTLAIAERCDVTFTEGADLMPRFPVPAGESEQSWLVKEVELGLLRRFGGAVSDAHRTQAAYEVGVMTQMGFPGYFLVTADLVRHAKETGIRVGPGRGSAAGSLVAYALGITELDPLKHGLLFERFLNPERISMPDIDLDFDERRRGDMIRYATELYGEERVAQIITYGTIKAKQAVKDSARVLGFPFAMGDRITKAMPAPVMGKDVSLKGIFDKSHPRYQEAGEFRALYESDPEVHRVVDNAKGLEGLKRQWGVHAAGVILSKEPLLDVVPIMRREQDGAIITQFDMGACETLGLLKMDFLGLRNLTVLDDCLANIEANRGETVVLETLGLDDRLAYELLTRGDTLGVFQLDGGPMRSLLRSMRPDNFEDISAVLALYRPGPMGANAHNDYADRKNGRQPVVALHPELEAPLAEILGDTHGLIVYQEQVMAIAQQLAGYTLGQADLLRRAMGKKKKEILDKEYVPFSDGMRERGYSAAAIKKLWEVLVPFSDYAFNKAHTAGYGLVSYWTAYLKANFPSEYMAALLTSIRDDKDKSALYLNECRRMGIKVLPPDVNESDSNYTPRGTDIRFGLSAIRNVGENVVRSIAATRSAKGRFSDFTDFLVKVDALACNKKTIESLIKAGAFDSLGHTRRGLIMIHAEAIDAVMDTKRAQAIGQYDLFGGGDDEPGTPFGLEMAISLGEWDKTALLAYEREMLGLYVSDHPLFGVEHIISAAADCSIAVLTGSEDRPDGSIVTVGGLVSGLQRKVTKKGDVWAIATLEDLEGAIEVMFFPQTYQLFSTTLAEDAVVLVRGRVDRRDDVPKLIALEMTLPDLSEGPRGPVVISLPIARCTPPVVDRLKEVLATHPGATEVHLRLQTASRTTVLRIDDGLRVNPGPALMGDLKALLGPSCLL